MNIVTFWKVIGIVVILGIGAKLISNKEDLKAKIATDEALLKFIEDKLSKPNLDEFTRFNLSDLADNVKVRITHNKEKQ